MSGFSGADRDELCTGARMGGGCTPTLASQFPWGSLKTSNKAALLGQEIRLQITSRDGTLVLREDVGRAGSTPRIYS
jgi:hypothetical protein